MTTTGMTTTVYTTTSVATIMTTARKFGISQSHKIKPIQGNLVYLRKNKSLI